MNHRGAQSQDGRTDWLSVVQ